MAALSTTTRRGWLWQQARERVTRGAAARWATERAHWAAASRTEQAYCAGGLAAAVPLALTLLALLQFAALSALLTAVGLPAPPIPRLVINALGSAFTAGVVVALITCAVVRATEVWAWARRRPWPVLSGGALAFAGAGWALAKTAGLFRARAMVAAATGVAPENFPNALGVLAWLQAALLAGGAFVVLLVVILALATVLGVLLVPFTAARVGERSTTLMLARQGQRAGTFGLCAAAAVLLVSILGPAETAIRQLTPAVIIHGDYALDRSCARHAPGEVVVHLQHPEGRISIATRGPDGRYNFRLGRCE